MAWFNEGLSSLKGQISNLTKEIVVPNLLTDTPQDDEQEAKTKNEFEDKCKILEKEMEKLKIENSQLRLQNLSLQTSSSSSHSSQEVATLEFDDDDFDDTFQAVGWGDDVWTDSFLGQKGDDDSTKDQKENVTTNLQKEVNKLLVEKKKLKKKCAQLTSQIDLYQTLTDQLTKDKLPKQDKNIQTTEDLKLDVTKNPEFIKLVQDVSELQDEKTRLTSELASVTQVVRNLESQVRVTEDENANLSTGLEELDVQYQQAIEQVVNAKDAAQKHCETLQTEFNELKEKYKELEKINETRNSEATNKVDVCIGTEKSSTGTDLEETIKPNNNDLFYEIKECIPLSILKNYYDEISGEECSILSLVLAIVEEYSHISSMNKMCSSKILKLESSLEELESSICELETENNDLYKENLALKNQSETFCSIPENDEVIAELNEKLVSLQKEIDILKEMKTGFEVELASERKKVSDLTKNLKENEALLKQLDDMQNDIIMLQDKEQILKNEIDSLSSIKNSLEKDNVELQQKLQNEVSSQDQDGHKYNLIEELLQSSKKTIEELTDEIILLKKNIDEKNEELNELNSKYLATVAKFSSLETNISEKNDVIESLKIDIESKERKMCELILEKSTSDKNFEDLKLVKINIDSTIKELQNDCINKDNFIKNLEVQLKEINDKYSSTVNRLKLISDENNDLKLKITNLNDLINTTTDECNRVDELEKKYSGLKQTYNDKSNECNGLQEKIKYLENVVGDLKNTLNAIEQEKNMLFEITKEESSLKSKYSEQSVLIKDLQNKLIIIDELKSTEIENIVSEKNKEISVLKNRLSELESTLNESLALQNNKNQDKDIENEKLIQRCLELQSVISEIKQRLSISEEEEQTISEKLNFALSGLKKNEEHVRVLNAKLADVDNENVNLKSKLLEYENSLEISKINQENFNKSKEKQEMALETITKLSKALADQEKENVDLKQMCKNVQGNVDQMPKLLEERDQLIKSLQTKHMEGVEYHNEIQRLNKLLKEELNKSTKLTSDISVINQNCLDLRQKMEDKEENLRYKDREIMNLKQQIETLQNQVEYASQLLRVADRQEAEGQPSNECMANSNNTELNKDYIVSLEKERNDLAEELLKEQTRNKYLQNEVQEHHEKEMNLSKEIDRLRSHLLSVEDNYTQEMVKAEEKVQELQTRLSQADERVKNSSTAYTSASIRANQQVESLQAQTRLLIEQRDKIQSQLSASEDKIQKQAAALTNLQIVLEQFQRDKDKDIALETERIKQNLQQAYNNNENLKAEIKSLQGQLRDAKEGLNAASRLGEQIERKDQTINDLKIKVDELTDKLYKMEEKIKSTNGVEGKIDRYLVKNLLVGYLSAPQQSKLQALRVLATVVDLSHEERQRVGLETASSLEILKQHSLSEAFVRFLENESRPQNPLFLPLAETTKESKSRRTSTSILLPEVLPSIPQFTSGRNSGSILKDVLKDDQL